MQKKKKKGEESPHFYETAENKGALTFGAMLSVQNQLLK